MPRYVDVDYLLSTYQAVCSAISCEECRAKYKNGTCKMEHWLKAQPTIEERKKGRYIDAEELKHILNNSKYYGTKAGNAFADMITECTTIDERKKGAWIFGDDVRCSNCNYKLQATGLPSHCPNCGANMMWE